MRYDELYAAVADVRYKPGWHVISGPMGEGFFVQWGFDAPCNMGGGMERQHGRKWYVSRFAARSEVVQTLLKAALAAEEHEAREQFLYKGLAVYGPHPDVEALWAAQLPEDRRATA